MKQGPPKKYLITEPVLFERTQTFTGRIEDIRKNLDELELEILNGRISYVTRKVKETGVNIKDLGIKVFDKRVDDIFIDQKEGTLIVGFRKEDNPEEAEDFNPIDMAETICYELERRFVSPKARLCRENPFPDDGFQSVPAFNPDDDDVSDEVRDLAEYSLEFIENEAPKGPNELITAILTTATGIVTLLNGNGEMDDLMKRLHDEWKDSLENAGQMEIAIPLNKKAS